MQWNKCIDKLPEESGFYLVYCDFKEVKYRFNSGLIPTILFYSDIEKKFDIKSCYEVTHWQTLPELPEE